ncbi:MAG: prephenate/arogenate dehydrogenase family protein [Caulobacteraceae bacterium]
MTASFSTPLPPRRLGLYAPFVVLLAFALAWSAGWLALRGEILRRMDAARRPASVSGRTLDWTSREVSGFPFRVDVTLDNPRLREPSGWALAAPRLAAEALVFAPTHWVFVAPDGATFTRPAGGAVIVGAKALRASLSDLGAHPPRLSVEGIGLTFRPAPGADPFFLTSADEFHLHTRAGPGDEGALFVELDGASAGLSGLMARIAGGGPLSLAGDAVYSHAAALTGADWAGAVRAWSAAGGALDVHRLRLAAGEAVIDAHAGTLTVDDAGRLAGSLAATLRRAPRSPPAGSREGLPAPEAAVTLDFNAGRTRLARPTSAPPPRFIDSLSAGPSYPPAMTDPASSVLYPRLAVIGCGLIGSSVIRAARAAGVVGEIAVADPSAAVRGRVVALGLADRVTADPAEAARGADLVVLAAPPLAIGEAAGQIAATLKSRATVTDVGSVKAAVAEALAKALPPDVFAIPGHPIAGSEESGPDAGFAAMFEGRWTILTPQARRDAPYLAAVDRLTAFWVALGAQVELMDERHHDLVLAVTSHLPHLIAYTIVGAAADLETVTRSEVIKYSAGGFRDFTRIAASDPVMWRDVFLANKDAVLEILGRFTEDLQALSRAIRWGEGDKLESLFTRTREIRRGVIEAGQETPEADFGRRRRSR